MGLCRQITLAIVGPALIYCLFLAHASFHFATTEPPKSMGVKDFPANVDKAAKDTIIAGRKALLKEHMNAFSGKPVQPYLDQFLAKDASFEDHWMLIDTAEGMRGIFHFTEKYLDSCEFDIQGEHHGVNEVVMNWVARFTFKTCCDYKIGPITLPMRQRIGLKQVAGKEQVAYIRDEYFGNAPLTEDNFKALPVLGKLHQGLRKLVGTVWTKVVFAHFA